jgi:hypothetical protein
MSLNQLFASSFWCLRFENFRLNEFDEKFDLWGFMSLTFERLSFLGLKCLNSINLFSEILIVLQAFAGSFDKKLFFLKKNLELFFLKKKSLT